MPGSGRLAVAALGAAALAIVSGCTHTSPHPPAATRPAPASSPTSTAPTAAAGPGSGVLRVGVPEEPASLDPFDPKSRTPAGEAVLGEVLPQLFRVDPSGREVGWLADDTTIRVAPRGPRPGSVNPGADGFVVSFALRPSARWSDGAPITVDDLRFTLRTVRSPAWPGPVAGYDRLVSVDGTGSSVTFVFDAPFPGWRRLFSGPDFVLPAHRLDGHNLATEWASGPDVAGGPFLLGSVTPGLEIDLVRNPGWWGGATRATGLRVMVVPDDRTMMQLLARGDLDVAWPPADTNRIGQYRAMSGVVVSVGEPGGRWQGLWANTAAVAPDRRRSLLGLVDRDRFVAVLLGGEAAPATSLVPPVAAGPAASGGAWVSAAPGAASGIAGVPLTRMVAPEEVPMGPILGRVVETRALAAGASLDLVFESAPVVEGDWLPGGAFDLALVDDVAWPEPCWRCWLADASIGRGNVARVKGFDAAAAAAERDPAGGGPLEAALRAQGIVLPLWRPRAVLAGRGVAGLVANSWSPGPFWGSEDWAPR